MNKTRKIIYIIVILLILLIISQYIEDKPLNNKTDNDKDILEVCFLDVGEADSTLIRYNDKNILIDAGNNLDGEYLVKYFKNNKIDKFNYLIATHPHEDHIGGMNEIINNFQIDHFLMTDIKINTKSYYDVIDSLKNNNYKFEVPNIDEVIEIDGLKLNILSIGNDNLNINNSSIVIKLNYKNISILLMADAEKEVEFDIINKDIKSDILKIGHHGSAYATSAQFLKKVNPKYAVISVGKDNDYGFPKKVVLNKLDKLNIKVLRTDIDNTICFYSDGDNINYNEKITNTNGGDLVIYEDN